MKNLTKIAFLILLTTEFSWAQKTGNGGAGVRRNGIYMTFGTAGLWTEPIPEEVQSIPGLDRLIDVISGSPFFVPQLKLNLMQNLLPSQKRKYYQVQRDKFDQTTEKRLIAEYRRAIKSEGDDLVLFAVTDTASKVTYLLPSFYELSEVEQMAILFHEAFWILRPDSTYQQVISVEVQMQKYLQDPKKATELRPVIEALSRGAVEEMIVWALQVDLQEKVANGTKRDATGQVIQLDAELFLGKKYIDCFKQSLRAYISPNCDYLRLENAIQLKRNYGHSEFIQLFARAVIDGRVSSHTGNYGSCHRCAPSDTGSLTLRLLSTGHDPRLDWQLPNEVNLFMSISR